MKFSQVFTFVFILMVLSSCTSPSILTNKELFMGDECCNKNEFNDAIVHYQSYLEKSKTLGKYRNIGIEASVNRKIGYAYCSFGKYENAFQCLCNALFLDSLDYNLNEFAEDYRLMGMAKAFLNNYDESLFYLSKAIKLTENFDISLKDDKQKLIADINLSLAQIHTALGDFESSNLYVRKSLQLYERTNNIEGRIQALQLLAWLQIEECNYSDAESNLLKSMEYAKKLKLFTIEQNGILAEIFEQKGKYEDMLRYRLQSLEQADSSNILPQIVWAEIKVGDAYKILGIYEKAKGHYLKANKLNEGFGISNLSPAIDYRVGDINVAFQSFKKNGMNFGIGISALKIGELFKSTQPDSAMFYFDQALDVFNTFKNKEYTYKVQLQVADLLINQNKNAEALKLLLIISDETKNDETSWQSLYLMARAYEKSQLNDKSIFCYKKSIDIIERIRGSLTMDEFRDSYLSDKIVVYDQLIQLLQNSGMPKEAWSYIEKARARSFLDMVAGKKIGKSQSADSSLIEKEQRLQSELIYLQKSIGEEVMNSDSIRGLSPNLNVKFKEKEAEYLDVIEQLRLYKSKYIQLVSASTVGLDQLQNKITSNQRIVEYWCGKDNLLIYVVSKDTLISRMVPIESVDLKKKIELCRKSIGDSKNESLTYLREMYDILWKPIENDLSTNKDICIIPHQYLHYLPFAALYKDSFLIEKYVIHNSISASLLKDDVLDKFDGQFLGIALNKSNVGNFQPLRNTEQEIKLIQRYYPNSTLAIEGNLSESFVKESIPKATVIHFATHGFYDDYQPLNSYLLLNSDAKNDGKLTVYEIFDSHTQANLTTLSACQTSMGKLSSGDEITSLSRAFLYAGSTNVISTMWNISDSSTPRLIEDFYNYHHQGRSYKEALCFAQRKFIRTTNSNPLLWSAFVLYN